jgi:multidrug efflux pump subunit AcrA (membrane-fusion protein)
LIAIAAALIPIAATSAQGTGKSTPARRPAGILARLLFVDRHALAFDRVGVLEETLEEGDVVKSGQIVARLRSEIAAAALAVADARVANEAEIVSAQKHYESAQAEYRSALTANENSLKRGLPASFEGSAIDRLRLTGEAAAAEIDKARKEHAVNQRARDQAKAELDAMMRTTPRDGLVTRIFKRTGEGVQAAEPVIEILSIGRIRVEAEIDVELGATLQVGDEVGVEIDFPSRQGAVTETFSTRLRFVDPALERVSKTVRVWAELPNPERRLREGLPARFLLSPVPSVAPVVPAAENATTKTPR